MIPGTRIPETAGEAALQRLEGAVKSNLANRGATVGHVLGQYQSAQQASVPPAMIGFVVRRAMAGLPKPDAARVAQITQLLLT